MPRVRKIGKIARRGGGKYLGNRLLILSRNGFAVKEEITAHILAFPRSRPFRPLVILRSVVHHEIHADADSFFPAGCRQTLQILHRPERRLHLPKIRYRITAVRAALWCIEKRHQMNVVDVTAFDIGQFFLHALQIPRKIVNVEHHAEHIVALVPVGPLLPLPILLFQITGPLLVEIVKSVAQFRKHGTIIVELHIQPSQLIQMSVKTSAVIRLRPGYPFLRLHFLRLRCRFLRPSRLCLRLRRRFFRLRCLCLLASHICLPASTLP